MKILAVAAMIGGILSAAQIGQLSQQAGPPPAPSDGKVRVYVYRLSDIASREFRPSVFVDEMDVARLQNGRFVILALAPGKHILRSTDKKDEVSLDLRIGARYFIRMDVSVIAVKARGKLNVVMAEQGSGEFSQTRPVDGGMLKERSLVAPEFVAAK